MSSPCTKLEIYGGVLPGGQRNCSVPGPLTLGACARLGREAEMEGLVWEDQTGIGAVDKETSVEGKEVGRTVTTVWGGKEELRTGVASGAWVSKSATGEALPHKETEA